jgi:hypothetical protein
MKKESKHISKKEFAQFALKNGLSLVGSPWNRGMDEIHALIDEKGESVLMALGGKRDKVTGNAQHLKRVKSDGGSSHLRLGKEDKIYAYGNFFLVRGEHPDGSNNTVIYA